ncbi:hypothetical protein WICMUC_004817 [Wickerhamomyces mucosus]|uniref:Uncharacterized protein n=1 Tax=Wickerhamomyces mucosus TaxID=1378264 RepID=A0A9P8T905_9ASCO|nr:hypothetical protein WICMUC_004817 [Wickerhamomyces mucosus]
MVFMDTIISIGLGFAGIICLARAVYDFIRYMESASIDTKVNYYPLDFRHLKNYKLIKLSKEEDHIWNENQDTLIFKIILTKNTFFYNIYQVTNYKNELICHIKSSKIPIIVRDYIHINANNSDFDGFGNPGNQLFSHPTQFTSSEMNILRPPRSGAITQGIHRSASIIESAPSSCNINITNTNSPYIDPTLYSNCEVNQSDLGPFAHIEINTGFLNRDVRKLSKICITKKRGFKEISFYLSKHSKKYRWHKLMLSKLSKDYNEKPLVENLGRIKKLKNFHNNETYVIIQLNIYQVGEIMGLSSAYLYFKQFNDAI